MPPIWSKKPANKLTPKEQRIAKAICDIKDSILKNVSIAA
jgi:hypothetical protein